MPELPEVETVRRGLAPTLESGRILRVELRRADLRFPFPDGFAAQLEGATITSLARRAKYLQADTDRGDVLVMHLGMSGSFRVLEGAEETVAPFHGAVGRKPKHDHVVLHIQADKGQGARARVVYNDPRRFGFMDLIKRSELEAHPYFVQMGVEPLGNALDGALLQELFAGRKTPLKAALLNQRFIAGLGNIYVCEALWRAGLSPFASANSICGDSTAAQITRNSLARHIKEVLQEAVAAGGSTLKDHASTDGSLGYFQHRFAVYGREGDPCLAKNCKDKINREVQSGRSTFFCPSCQPR
ncbi:bifunctional DNA-formamidopyrimidine glycosylase/DNA-(apurinic or apyrimidinic site) lyase [Polycladidibacter hongkongensis]|uniref:bifunctional DNA-formamidopyrimidine glycosylase/DNA-(apurinic or apyrimidinic site) lyase n=1 Tax=Polycladidibacter hongkongensis TaxID=1647556 RepID=UPI0008341025|nr:bifunctional DNA-formamidopyrimidine glycosylase/DNA-(apurinic or apyrimidinic site) lyase [Pseudovibrio hongkongensis]